MIELPEICYAAHPEDGHVVVIIREEAGYRESLASIEAGVTAEEINKAIGITPEQANAMLAGSMFGWECPAARGEVP